MRWLGPSLLLVAGCGEPTPPPPSPKACEALKHASSSQANHLPSCTDSGCGNGENPPTGGDHCGTVIACKSYASDQPRCSWIHNLEHGHVVLLFKCPQGCADDIDKLEKLRAGAKQGSNGVRRAIVAPDAALATKFAAVAWGWSWTGETLDEEAIRCVLGKQDAEAPEPGLPCAP